MHSPNNKSISSPQLPTAVAAKNHPSDASSNSQNGDSFEMVNQDAHQRRNDASEAFGEEASNSASPHSSDENDLRTLRSEEENRSHPNFNFFPNEIWLHVFSYLPVGFLVLEKGDGEGDSAADTKQITTTSGTAITSSTTTSSTTPTSTDSTQPKASTVSSSGTPHDSRGSIVTDATNQTSAEASTTTTTSTVTTRRPVINNISTSSSASNSSTRHVYINIVNYKLVCKQFNLILSSKLFWDEAYGQVFFTDRISLSDLSLSQIQKKFMNQMKLLEGSYVNCGKAHHLDLYLYYVDLGSSNSPPAHEARLIEKKMQQIIAIMKAEHEEMNKKNPNVKDHASLGRSKSWNAIHNGSSLPSPGSMKSMNSTTSVLSSKTSSRAAPSLDWPKSFSCGIRFIHGKTFRIDEDIRSTLTGVQFGRMVALSQRWVSSSHFVTSTIATIDEVMDPSHPEQVQELNGYWNDVYQYHGSFSMVKKSADNPLTNDLDDDDNIYTTHWIQRFSQDSKRKDPIIMVESSRWCDMDAYIFNDSVSLQDSTVDSAFVHRRFTLKLRNTFHSEIKTCYVGGSAYQIQEDGSQGGECVVVGNLRENYFSFIIFHGPDTEVKMRVLCRIVRMRKNRIQEMLGVAYNDEGICGVVRVAATGREVEKFKLSTLGSLRI